MIKNSNLSSILIYLIPIALVTGPLIPDLIVSFVCIVFLYEIIRDKKFFYLKNNFFLLFSLFWIVSILSSLFSENLFISLKSSLFYFRFGILALCIFKNITENKFNFKIFFTYF